MNSVSVQKTAKTLSVLVDITFVCNLLALPVVPPLVYWRGNPFVQAAKQALNGNLFHSWTEGMSKVWAEPYTLILTLFLLVAGCCTAVILWQARQVLKTILRGEPFSVENAASLNRAAICSFAISGAALVRLLFSMGFYCSIRPLMTYNALFVPVFAMAGLLCMVMAALFRQAAEIKAENDLTI